MRRKRQRLIATEDANPKADCGTNSASAVLAFSGSKGGLKL
jgi:hypothetical protein